MAEKESSALEYSRRIYDGVLGWYKNADSKAQIILTIDGAFIAFLTISIFSEQRLLSDMLSRFGPETWTLLALMCATLAGSVLSSVRCLWSRIYSKDELDEKLTKGGVDPKRSKTYKPEFMLFFQFISKLDAEQMTEKLLKASEEDEIESLAYDAQALSENVLKKHKWVNLGFALAGSSLLLFLGAGISYVIRASA